MVRRVSLLAGSLLTLFVGAAYAVELEGQVEWARPLTLSTNLAAEVVEGRVVAGERVKKGDRLMQLESGVARARVAQAEAELAYQRLLLAESQSELKRSEELYDRTLLSDHDLDLARIAYAAAQGTHRRAESELKAAQRDLSLRQIVAPFDAQVVERFVHTGETINGQFKSVALISLRPVERRRLLLDVESGTVPKMRPGDGVGVTVKGRRYDATLSEIVSSSEKSPQGRQLLEISFTADNNGSPMPGETARVTLP